MDATLTGLLKLLAEADPETRCAALVVLSRLGADEPKVVTAVQKALAAKNEVVRDFAFGYFEAVKPTGAVTTLIPFLDSEDGGLRQRATILLAEYGAPAIIAVKKLVTTGPRRRINAIIELCARVRSAAALELLFERMASEDFEANRAACDALLAVVPALGPKQRAALHEHSDRLAAGAKQSRPALIAAAKLFGALADPKPRKRLFAQIHHPDHAVVTHALGALVQCLRTQKLSSAEIEALLPLLDGDDEQGVLRPVVRLLEDQPLDRAYLGRLNQLAESPQPLVKRLAIQKLGTFESGNVVKTLIGYLTDDSYARRDQATTSLKAMPAARQALMKEFLDSDDERAAWTLGEVLLAHDRNWKRDIRGALAKRLEATLEKRDDRLHTAYFHFLNALDSDETTVLIRQRAEQLRKAKKFPLAARWLGLLRNTPALDNDGKFLLALAELKSHKHALTAAIRRHDSTLESLRTLAASSFPIGERLRKERALTPDELFYIAFNFAEGSRPERELAEELLTQIVTKHGRTKVGKAAKNKLQLLQRSL